MLETNLDPSRTHKRRGKQKPIYKRKQGLRTKAKKPHFKPQGKKINFCFGGNVLGNVQFSLWPSWEAVRCVLEDGVNDSKPKKLFHVDNKNHHWGTHFLLAPPACPLYEQENRHPCHVYRPCLVICLMDRELKAVLPTLLIGKTWN